MIEYLVKLKLFRLVRDVVYSTSRYTMSKTINCEGRDLQDVLGFDRSWIPLLQEVDPGIAQLRIIRAFIGTGKKLDASMMKWCADNAVQDASVLMELLSYTSMHKLCRYADAQYEGYRKATKVWYCEVERSMANLLTDYCDYLRMCKELQYDVKNSFILFPHKLKDAHDSAAKTLRDKHTAEQEKAIADSFDEWQKRYQYQSKELMACFERILKMTQGELKEYLAQQLREYGYEPVCKNGFLYAEGTIPVLLVAHLDTVHTHQPDIICRSEDGRYLMSPYGIGGDDRAGVYMILLLMRKCRCHILFCEEEEVGGVGARKFAKSKLRPEVNYIVELDRRGTNDAVFYNCDNPDFTEFVCSFGFEENYGSFSDISVVAPHLDTAAVNISAGYFNEHRLHEMIDTYAMCKNVLRLTAMLQQQTGHFPYQERIHRRGSMYGAQTSLFAPMIDRQPQKCACKLLMPLPEETRLYMGQHQIGYAPEYMMDRAGNLYMYLECLKAAVEAEGVFACNDEGQPPAFSAVCEGTRFLQVYTYEEAVEKLEQAEDAG